jgi:hypothetical protein
MAGGGSIGSAVCEPGKKYCTYCRLPKPAEGFKEVRDKSGRLRNHKCGDCSDMKNRSAKERDALSERRRKERKDAETRRMQELTKAREAGRASTLESRGTVKRHGDK